MGTGPERGEGGGERTVAAHGQAGGGGHHLLLGDVHLEVPVRVGLGELEGKGGVLDLAIQCHDLRVTGAQGNQRVPVGLAGGHLVADGVLRRCRASVCWRGRLVAGGNRLRARAAQHQVADAAELGDRPVGHVRREGPAVPAFLILDLGEPAALDRLGQDHRGLPAGDVALGRGQGAVDLGQVVTVDDHDAGTERRGAGGVGIEVPAELGRAALPEPVDVDDNDQVGQAVMGGLVQRLPDRALGQLAVAAQHPDPVRQPVQVLASQRDPHPVGQPLAERAGGHVHPGQDRGRVALKALPEPPVPGHQLLLGDDADGLERRVQQRRGVALGEDQVVVGGQPRVVPVVAQVPGDEHGEQIGRRHAGGRVPRACAGRRADRVPPGAARPVRLPRRGRSRT